MEIITANCGEENKGGEVYVNGLIDNQRIGLIKHYHGAAGDKQAGK